MIDKIEVTLSSGNVFEDLGLPNPSELLIKAELVRQINEIIVPKNLTLGAAAKCLGVDFATITSLLNGELSKFSKETLLHFLNALRCNNAWHSIIKLLQSTQQVTWASLTGLSNCKSDICCPAWREIKCSDAENIKSGLACWLWANNCPKKQDVLVRGQLRAGHPQPSCQWVVSKKWQWQLGKTSKQSCFNFKRGSLCDHCSTLMLILAAMLIFQL